MCPQMLVDTRYVVPCAGVNSEEAMAVLHDAITYFRKDKWNSMICTTSFQSNVDHIQSKDPFGIFGSAY